MKWLTIVALLIGINQFAFAEEAKVNFAEKKEKMLAVIDARITSLNAEKSCVSSASDMAAIKKCMTAKREKMQEARKARRQIHKDRKAKKGK